MKLTKIKKNFRLIASTKNNLKIAEKQIVQGTVMTTCHTLQIVQGIVMTTCHTLLLGLRITKSAWYIFQMQIVLILVRYKSLYIYVNTIYVIKNQHCRS